MKFKQNQKVRIQFQAEYHDQWVDTFEFVTVDNEDDFETIYIKKEHVTPDNGVYKINTTAEIKLVDEYDDELPYLVLVDGVEDEQWIPESILKPFIQTYEF